MFLRIFLFFLTFFARTECVVRVARRKKGRTVKTVRPLVNFAAGLFVGSVLRNDAVDVFVSLAPNLIPLHGVYGTEHRLGADDEVSFLIGQIHIGAATCHVADKSVDLCHGIQMNFDSHNKDSFLVIQNIT